MSIDLTGQKFSRLLPIMRYTEDRYTKYICLCDCGEYVIVTGKSLARGGTMSCGCLRREVWAKYNLARAKTKNIKNRKTICSKCGKERFVNTRCEHCRRLYFKAYHKKTYSKKKDKHSAQAKIYYKNNKVEINAKRKIYEEANSCKVIARDKARHTAYYIKNKERIYARTRQRRKTDPKFRLRCNMSNAISDSLRNGKGNRSWLKLVNYTLEKLQKHLEKQFVKEMSWSNYGKNGWHIDHKIPVSVFNFTKPEHTDFKECWALKNLQPMWAKDNLEKSAKLTKHFQPSLLI